MTIFQNPADVDALLSDRLIQAGRNYLPGQTLAREYVWNKLLAAEKDTAHRLRCFLEPTEVIPEGYADDEINGLATPWVEEPAYDYNPDFFTGDRWGFLQARHRPIIRVSYFQFAYPNLQHGIFKVPVEWIRVDKKYGTINLVPTGSYGAVPLNAYVLSAVGGGRTIPHMIQVRYTAGLANAANDYPDLVDLIKRTAVLHIVEDAFQPQSASISADGLSENLSLDLQKYRDSIDQGLDRLRDQIHGVRMAVL